MQLLKQSNRNSILNAASLLVFVFLNIKAFSQLNPAFGAGFQPSRNQVIKFKIAKIIIKYEGDSSISDEYYFDKNGNDTAVYHNGKLAWAKKYEKGRQGRITKWVQYDSLRMLQYTASYIYETDGSYTIHIADEEYKLRIHSETFNKEDKIQSEFLMDGGQHFYKYDSLGRLSRIDSRPGIDGYDQYTAEYSYDINNILRSIRTVINPFDYESLEKFYYDNKGLLAKSETTITYTYDKKKGIYVSTYSYFFRKY